MDTLFDFADFEETKALAPVVFAPVMLPCGIHQEHRQGDEHVAECWGGICPDCGDEVLSGFLMRLNHSGAERGSCVSVFLRLNHLSYAIRNHEKPNDRDMTVIDLGWRIAPDGTQIPPVGKAAA